MLYTRSRAEDSMQNEVHSKEKFEWWGLANKKCGLYTPIVTPLVGCSLQPVSGCMIKETIKQLFNDSLRMTLIGVWFFCIGLAENDNNLEYNRIAVSIVYSLSAVGATAH